MARSTLRKNTHVHLYTFRLRNVIPPVLSSSNRSNIFIICMNSGGEKSVMLSSISQPPNTLNSIQPLPVDLVKAPIHKFRSICENERKKMTIGNMCIPYLRCNHFYKVRVGNRSCTLLIHALACINNS